jgi:hypothetical protein
LKWASPRNTGTSATSSKAISQGAKTRRPAAKLATVTISWACPISCDIRVRRPLVCRRARSSWSWNSASSKSSRSRVAACSIKLTLEALVTRSDKRLSTNSTTRPRISDRTASTSSARISTPSQLSRPLASQSSKVAGRPGICTRCTTSSMISLPI